MLTAPLIGADAVANATETLAYVTGVLALVTTILAGATIVLVCVTRRGMKAAHDDTDRLIRATNDQVVATRKAAEDQISAMQVATANEIAATREAAEQQVAAARQQLDAEHLPFLIEVLPTGPVFPDMGARDNPVIAPGSSRRDIPQTIPLAFDHAREVEEVDPRHVVVRIDGGMVFVSLPLRNVGRGLAIIDTANITLSGSPWIGGLKTHPRAQPERVPVGETTRIYVISEYVTASSPQGPTRMTPDDRWSLRVPYRDFAWRQPSVAEIVLGYRGDGPASHSEWFVSTLRTEPLPDAGGIATADDSPPAEA